MAVRGACTAALQLLQNLGYSGLMQKLVTGEVRVKGENRKKKAEM